MTGDASCFALQEEMEVEGAGSLAETLPPPPAPCQPSTKTIQVTIVTEEEELMALNQLVQLDCDVQSKWLEFFHLYAPNLSFDPSLYIISSHSGKCAVYLNQRVEVFLSLFKRALTSITVFISKRVQEEDGGYMGSPEPHKLREAYEGHGLLSHIPTVPISMDSAMQAFWNADDPQNPFIDENVAGRSNSNLLENSKNHNNNHQRNGGVIIYSAGEKRKATETLDYRYRFKGVKASTSDLGVIISATTDRSTLRTPSPPRPPRGIPRGIPPANITPMSYAQRSTRTMLQRQSIPCTAVRDVGVEEGDRHLEENKRKLIRAVFHPFYTEEDLKLVIDELVEFRDSEKWYKFATDLPRLSSVLEYIFDKEFNDAAWASYSKSVDHNK